jgi:hypothetical protein
MSRRTISERDKDKKVPDTFSGLVDHQSIEPIAMVVVRTTQDIVPAVEAVVQALQSQHKHHAASQLEIVLNGYWSTGSEFLEELDRVLLSILERQANQLDRFTIQDLTAISKVIQNWFLEAKANSVRFIPPPSNQSREKPPSSLKNWIQENEDSQS